MKRHRQHNGAKFVTLVLIVFLFGGLIGVAEEAGRPVKRARPPKWSADVLDAFFNDAREKLVGTRPDYSQATTIARADLKPASNLSTTAAGPTVAAWSKLIDADTLETEIKRLAQAVAQDVTTPSEFKGGAYKECRRHFSVLAMLFAIAAEYDGEARWQDAAPALRDLFSRAGYNCKVGTDQTYQEASQRKQDLADLVRGSRPQVREAERAADWGQVADRSLLMQRMNIAHEERLTKWLANEREFAERRDDVRHEAQLVAAIAVVVGREGFDYWDEEEYVQYLRELRQATSEVAAAAELNNYQQARQAIDRATKSCASCHEVYRG